MNRKDLIESLQRHRGDAAAISGPGTISRLLFTTGHRPASLYQMDMGYATAMALGVAMAQPRRRVVAVEGDGSIVAELCVLATIGRYRPANLAVLVADNGIYASAGDGTVTTATSHGTDIAAVARACGLDAEHAFTVTDPAEADRAIARAMTEAGPWVIVAKLDAEDRGLMQGAKARGVIAHDIVETVIQFRRELAKPG